MARDFAREDLKIEKRPLSVRELAAVGTREVGVPREKVSVRAYEGEGEDEIPHPDQDKRDRLREIDRHSRDLNRESQKIRNELAREKAYDDRARDGVAYPLSAIPELGIVGGALAIFDQIGKGFGSWANLEIAKEIPKNVITKLSSEWTA